MHPQESIKNEHLKEPDDLYFPPALPRTSDFVPSSPKDRTFHIADTELNLLDLLRFLRAQKRLILLTTSLTTAIATAAAFLVTPTYEATALLAPVSPERETGQLATIANRFGGIAAMAGIDIGDNDIDIEAALATLQSRDFTVRFINDNHLLPILFDDLWNPVTAAWDVDDPADIPTSWDAFEEFDDIRTVNRDKNTGLVTLTIVWSDPHLAARWANGLVDRINKEQQQRAIDEANKSIEFLKTHLEHTRIIDVQQAVWSLVEAQSKKIMLAHVRDEYAFEILDPAVPPDSDEFSSPNRPLWITAGVTLGLILGSLLGLIRQLTIRPDAAASN